MADGKDISHGMPNEDLWRLIRRFDKQVSHVHAVPQSQIQQLDLNRAADEQFPPAKLQKTIDRFYISVIVKVGLFFNHVNRLRSWEQPHRTGTFGAVYLVAWLCNLLIPMLSGTLVLMVFSPSVRSSLFPPISEMQASSTKDSEPAQGTPQVAGEQTEIDATNFVNGLTTSMAEGSNEPVQAETPEPGNTETPGDGTDETGTPKKAPPAITVTMRALSDITDLCERLSNLFSPSPPFTLIGPRLQIAGILLSICLASLLMSSHVIVKAGSLIVGLAFFSDPVLTRGVDFLDRNIPDWKACLDIDKTLLKGVPANAQLTLTLLRLGEINSTPIPAPPPPGVYKSQYPSQWQLLRTKSKAESDQKKASETDSLSLSPTEATDETQDDQHKTSSERMSKLKAKPKKWLRILTFARRAISTAIKGHIAYNRAMALTGAGSKFYAKGLIAAVLERNINLLTIAPSLSAGPFTFDAKFERKRGTAVIDSSSSTDGSPILYFTSRAAAKLNMEDLSVQSQKADAVGFQVRVADIRELRKTEGLGWKGKLIVQLAAAGEEAPNEGLVVQGLEPAQTFHLTDMRGRNTLFNRLVAGGAQCWEMY
ncbi:hypothetical protein BJX76DRAFT_319668 [Aspergillus varians]